MRDMLSLHVANLLGVYLPEPNDDHSVGRAVIATGCTVIVTAFAGFWAVVGAADSGVCAAVLLVALSTSESVFFAVAAFFARSSAVLADHGLRTPGAGLLSLGSI